MRVDAALYLESHVIIMSIGLVGRVVGTKMQKTAKVEVFRLSLDPYVLKVSHFVRNSCRILWCPEINEFLVVVL